MVNSSYDPELSLLLAQASALTYVQFANSQQDPNYDGTITPPNGFKQTAVFKAPEINFQHKSTADSTDNLHPEDLDPQKTDLTDIKVLEDKFQWVKKVFFGFALEATDGSGRGIIALRGTQYPYEWLMDAAFVQVPVPLAWFEDKKLELAKAHFGFLFLYAFLLGQVTEAARKFNNSKTCFVTGHSLGAALAVLAALNLGTTVFPLGGRNGKVQMYNFAGPRVGDKTFADAYNYFVPGSFRVVNQADMVPVVPPSRILKYQYQHIGNPDQEWWYLYQTGDIAGNHSLEHNYTPALQYPGFVTNQKAPIPVMQEVAAGKEG
jgi:triacylglycerol lipase